MRTASAEKKNGAHEREHFGEESTGMTWEILKWAIGAVIALAWIGWTEASRP